MFLCRISNKIMAEICCEINNLQSPYLLYIPTWHIIRKDNWIILLLLIYKFWGKGIHYHVIVHRIELRPTQLHPLAQIIVYVVVAFKSLIHSHFGKLSTFPSCFRFIRNFQCCVWLKYILSLSELLIFSVNTFLFHFFIQTRRWRY